MFGFFRSRPPQTKNKSKKPPRRRWRRKLFVGLLLLGTLVWFAPVIIANTGLCNWLLGKALADLRGTCRVGSASLSWLTPPVFDNVEVFDEAGNRVLHIPRIEANKRLIDLVRDSGDVGSIRIVRPELHVVCGEEKSNLEDLLANWLNKKDRQSPPSIPGLNVEVVEARVVVDTHEEKKWTFHPVNLKVALPREKDQERRVTLDAGITEGDVTAAGGVTADVRISRVEPGEKPRTRVEGAVRLEQMTVESLQPLLGRLAPGLTVQGKLNGEAGLLLETGGESAPVVRLKGTLNGKGVKLSGPLLENDELDLSELYVGCDVQTQDDVIQVKMADVRTELGKASLSGQIDTTREGMAMVMMPGQKVTADVDLARLARMLPHFLSLHDGTEVTSGHVQLEAGSEVDDAGLIWKARVDAAELRWNRDGDSFTWKEPVVVDLRLRHKGEGLPVVERGHLDAGFVKVEGSGTAQQMTISASADLDRLTNQLDQLFNIGAWRPSGRVAGKFTISLPDGKGFRAWGQTVFQNLNLPTGEDTAFRETQVVVDLDMSGTNSDNDVTQLDRGLITLRFGTDVLELRLTRPVADLGSGIFDSVSLVMRGDLARWHARVKPWTDLTDDWTMAGQADIVAVLSRDDEGIKFAGTEMKFQNLDYRGLGLSMKEPLVEIRTAGGYNEATWQIDFQSTSLVASDFKANLNSLIIAFPADVDIAVTGKGTLEGSVARVQRWFTDPDPAIDDVIQGHCEGKFELFPAEGRIGIKTDLNVRDLVYGPPTNPSWSEPLLRASAVGRYDIDADRIDIERCRIGTDLFACEGKGKLDNALTTMDLVFDGRLEYDLAKFEVSLGEGVQLTGKGHRPLHLEGRLWPDGDESMWKSLRGSTAFHWDAIKAHGMTLAGTEVKANLENGWVRTEPIETTMNSGRVKVLPAVKVHPDPMEIYLLKGTGIDRFQVDPNLCATGLRYALPVLSGVLQAQGEMSLSLEGARIPFASPMLADLEGRIVIHSAELGASPLIREISALFGKPASVSLTRESIVKVKMTKGWVYHENLQMVVSGVPVSTSGWVSTTGQLSMVVQTPIPPSWLPGDRAREMFAKQTIQIPLGGTLSQPKFDEKALRESAQQMARKAADDLIRDNVNKGVQTGTQTINKEVEKIENKINEEVDKRLRELFKPGKRE